MKCLPRFFSFGVCLVMSLSFLRAQNVFHPSNPTKHQTGLQAYTPVRDWRILGSLYFSNQNTATGFDALVSNTTGVDNTADGYATLELNTTGSQNVGVGFFSLQSNTTGSANTAVGSLAMQDGNGNANTALGAYALAFNTTGNSNTAIGEWALNNGIPGNPSENNSVAVGYEALYSSMSTTGNNSAIGYRAMYGNTTGSNNTAIGDGALSSNTEGTYNTALGVDAGPSKVKLNNTTAVGANSTPTAGNSVMVGSSAVTSIGGYANWTNFSDGRYKKNIQQNVPGLAFINKLTPVTYTLDVDGIEAKLHEGITPAKGNTQAKTAAYQNDPVYKQAMQEKSAVSYTGLVAQDVEKAASSIGYDFSGIDKPKDAGTSFYGLRYGDFVVPLVKAVQELSASGNKKDSMINALQGQIDSLQTQLQTQINELRSMLLSKNQTVTLSGASLEQNIPNPTSNSTIIGYNLPQGTSSAQMQIIDMNGKIIRIIPLAGSGRNTMSVDTSSLAVGMYTYSLLVNGQLAATKKMLSVK